MKDPKGKHDQEELNIQNCLHAIMSVDELDVLLQGCTHRMERYMPKNYFNSPITAARRRSYLNVARYGRYINYYLMCLIMHEYEQKLSHSLIHVEKPVL